MKIKQKKKREFYINYYNLKIFNFQIALIELLVKLLVEFLQNVLKIKMFQK